MWGNSRFQGDVLLLHSCQSIYISGSISRLSILAVSGAGSFDFVVQVFVDNFLMLPLSVDIFHVRR